MSGKHIYYINFIFLQCFIVEILTHYGTRPLPRYYHVKMKTNLVKKYCRTTFESLLNLFKSENSCFSRRTYPDNELNFRRTREGSCGFGHVLSDRQNPVFQLLINHQRFRGALFYNTHAILVFISALLIACSSVFKDCSCILYWSLCVLLQYFYKI